jgi:hypothetical protein
MTVSGAKAPSAARAVLFLLAITVATLPSSAAPSRPRLIIDSPAKGQTMEPIAGLDSAVVVKWRTQGFRVVPLGEERDDEDESGPGGKQTAAARSGKEGRHGEGHLRVRIDDSPWFLVHSSSDPIVVAGFPRGPHAIVLELVDRRHQPLQPAERASISFTVGAAEP